MENQNFNIALVDDHDLFREGLKYIIERHPNYSILFEAKNGSKFIHSLKNIGLPDLVLMDIEMPEMNGMEAAKQALSLHPSLKIVVLSMFSDQQYYREMIALGVKGFILKDSGKSELERALEDVLKGGNYFSQELLKNIIAGIPEKVNNTMGLHEPLSTRELEVLQLVCQGLSNNEIAEKLFLSPKTVEGHKAKLMLKTETKNTVSLVMFAIKNHLVELP